MYPSSEPPRAHPLLYVVLVVTLVNLLLTGTLWFSAGHRQQPQSDTPSTSDSLPSYLDEAGLANIASDLTHYYNAQDGEAFYAAMDDLAKVQLSLKDIQSELDRLPALVGKIEASAYSHYESSTYGSFPSYNLIYKVRLAGGPFEGGTLSVSVIDRGGRHGLIGFRVNGASE